MQDDVPLDAAARLDRVRLWMTISLGVALLPSLWMFWRFFSGGQVPPWVFWLLVGAWAPFYGLSLLFRCPRCKARLGNNLLAKVCTRCGARLLREDARRDR